MAGDITVLGTVLAAAEGPTGPTDPGTSDGPDATPEVGATCAGEPAEMAAPLALGPRGDRVRSSKGEPGSTSGICTTGTLSGTYMFGPLGEEDDAAAKGISKPGGGNTGIGGNCCGNKTGAEPDITTGGGSDNSRAPSRKLGTAPEPGAGGGGVASGTIENASSPLSTARNY